MAHNGTSSTITWEAPDAGVWELEAAHGNQIPPVTLQREFENAFSEGFRTTFTTLGVPLSHIELRHVNGWPYVSFFLHDVPRTAGDPPPAILLKVLTRLHPGFRKRTRIARHAIAERRPQRLSDDWFAERENWIERIVELQRRNLDDLDNAALADHTRAVATLTTEAAQRHFQLVAGCIPLGQWLHHSQRWGLDPAEARDGVMHGVPVHTEARQRLRRVADALGNASVADLDSIRAFSAAAADALDDYIEHHGWWALADGIVGGRVIDAPHLISGSVRAQPHTAVTDPAAAPSADLLARLAASVAPAEREHFHRLAHDAHRAYAMLEDNSGILASWSLGLAGHVLRAGSQRLTVAGRLHQPDHIWALTIDEVVAHLDGRSAPNPDDAADRHAAWRARAQLHAPATLNGTPSPPPDPSVFPAPVAQLVTGIATFLGDKFNYANTVTGIGTTTVVGRAVVALDAADAIDRIGPGDILVTSSTTPAYNSILPVVAGLIVTTGGPSCHAAIMARELGIPALIGHREALTLTDGATIELDPVRATVRTVPARQSE